MSCCLRLLKSVEALSAINRFHAVSNCAGKPRAILAVAASPALQVPIGTNVKPALREGFEVRLHQGRDPVENRGLRTHIVRNDGGDLILA